jgi:hypothetical protein
MRATDGAPTRFAAAQAEVRQIIDGLGPGDQMTLILVGREPAVLLGATSDRARLRQALEAATPEHGAVDWQSAIALAAGAAQGFRDVRIVIVTDGGLPENLPPLAADTVVLPVGETTENLALTALATRAGEGGAQLLAQVRNYGLREQEALLSLRVNGQLTDSRRLSVPASENVSLSWPLPSSAATIRADLTNITEDALPADNVAWTVHQRGVQRRVLLVTEGNLFLERALAVLPAVKPFLTDAPFGSGDDVATANTETDLFDLVIYDRIVPAELPSRGNLLFVAPPESIVDLFTVSGTISNTAAIRIADDPLLQYVRWSDIAVRNAKRVTAPWAEPLVETEAGPLLLAGINDGRRVVLLTFALADSDLPLQVAFPILMTNFIDWLAPGRVALVTDGVEPGELVPLAPPASATYLEIEKPNGEQWTAEALDDQIVFTDTGLPGLYRLRVGDPMGEQPAGAFAVNLFDPTESQIRPARALSLGQSGLPATGAQEAVGRNELWAWLAVLALLLLAGEWWVYHEGARVPQPHDFPAIRTRWRLPRTRKERYNTES